MAFFTCGHARALLVWRSRVQTGHDRRVDLAAGMGARVVAGRPGTLRARPRVEPAEAESDRARPVDRNEELTRTESAGVPHGGLGANVGAARGNGSDTGGGTTVGGRRGDGSTGLGLRIGGRQEAGSRSYAQTDEGGELP